MSVIITNPESALSVSDSTAGDAFSLTNGPPENGFQTSEFVDPSNTIIFANQTDFIADGGGTKHAVTLDNPNPAAGLEDVIIQNLGAGSDVEGGSTSGADITVGTLTLSFSAAGDIGDTRALRTQVNNLAVNDAGNVRITNGVSTPTTLNASVNATGFVNLTNNGTINTTGSGVIGTAGINITATGSTADLDTGSGAFIDSGVGAVSLMVGEDINLGDAVGTGSVFGATGINLSAGRNVTLNANAIIEDTGSGNISINAGMAGAGGDITMLTSPGSVSNDPEIINLAFTGSISLTTGAGGTLTIASTNGAAGVESTNGAITLAADAMAISAGIDSGTATTTLEPVTAGQAITLGGANAPGVLGLTQAELNEITAGTLRIGDIIAGNITIKAAISNPSGDQIVSLVNNGAITESGFGSLSIPDLRISSTGTVTLGSTNNIIATLAASVTDGLTVNDNTHILGVGTVDTVTGISTNNSAINLTADGMNLGQQVNAGTGIVTLSTFTASQQVSLGGTSGNIAGTLGLSDAELGEITAGVLRIDAGTGNITTGGTISSHAGYSTLSLATAGDINLTNDVSVTNLALNSGLGIAVDGTNSIGTVAFSNAANNVVITDFAPLTIGSVDGITSSSNLGSTTLIDCDGNMTFATGFYSAGAATLTAVGASFVDMGNGAFVDVTAPSLALAAQTGVGTSGTPLQTKIGALSATTSTGGIYINNDSGVPGTLNIGVGSTGVSAGSGDISIINNGTINSLISGDNISGAGNITLKALGANADINLGSQASAFSIDDTGSSGLVDVEAGRDLNLGNSAGLGAIDGGSGTASVNLVAGRNLTIDANAYVLVSGSITATAGGSFTMTTTPGTLGDEFITGGGAIALTAGAGATMTLTSSGATAVSSEGGNITLTADFLNIGKAVNATTSGNVLIQPVTAGEQVSLGSAVAGGLTLTNTELEDITAKTITIGNSSAGEVSLAGSITPTSGTNLTINTGSGVVASSATISLGSGVLTIGFDESGTGGTADLRSLSAGASAIDVIGGAGNDIFLPSTSSIMTMTGGGGADTFEGTGEELTGNTITDLSSGDKIVITDANIASFSYQLNGTTLTFGSDTLTLSNAPTGHFIVTADPVAGVDMTYYAPPPADFNGDGMSDMLFQNTDGSFLDWTMNGSQITAAQSLTYQSNTVNLPPAYSVAGVGDFNGDGKADILLSNTNGTFVDWTMNGSQIAAAQMVTFGGNTVSLNPSYSVAGVGDFNGDNKADILLRNTNGTFVDWTMNGSQIAAAQVVTFGGNTVSLGSSWSVAGVGDFNGDGKADILLHNINGTFVDWTMEGSQIAAAQMVTYQGNTVTLDPTWSVVGVGDLNGGGDADILLRNTNGTLFDWTMNGSSIVGAQFITYQGNPVNLDASWSVVEVGDFDGDGKDDIMLRNTNGTFFDWTMNGSQIVGAQFVTSQGNTANLANNYQTETNPATGGPGTQVVAGGSTVSNPTIAGGVLDLMSGAIVNGPITFVAGTTGTLLDADQASLPDTVMGFAEGADYLKFAGETSSAIASVVASAQVVNGNTVLTFPDSTSIVLAGVTHVDAGGFA